MTLEQLAEQLTAQLTGHADPKETAPMDLLAVSNALEHAYQTGRNESRLALGRILTRVDKALEAES